MADDRMADDALTKLLDLLDAKAFDPVLEASADDVDEAERERLREAKSTAKSAKKRYHKKYSTAKEVVDSFHNDLSSGAVKPVDEGLEDLGLPTLPRIRGEFDSLARDLGVE